MVGMQLVSRFAKAYSLFDMPETRRIHSQPIPRLGGVAMLFGFILTSILFSTLFKFPKVLLGIYIPSLILFLMGLMDDIRPLGAFVRLGIQIFCTLITLSICQIKVQNIVFFQNIVWTLPPWVGYALASFIVVGSINSINMIDGLDGLASGIVLIGISLLSYLHFTVSLDSQLFLLLILPIIGTILGFLRYNTYPARIFMGDGGSNWLGFMSGILMILILGQYSLVSGTIDKYFVSRPGNEIPFLSVILCFALPVLDTASVIMNRLVRGQHPMHPDKLHFHHTLIRLGLTQKQSVTALYFFALTLGIAGLSPILFPRYSLNWVPYILSFITLSIFVFSSKLDENKVQKVASYFLILHSEVSTPVKIITRALEIINIIVISFIFVGIPLFSGSIPKTIGLFGISSGILFLLTFVISSRANDLLHSIVLFLGAIVLLISNNHNALSVAFGDRILSIQGLYNALFYWLGFSSAFLMLLSFRRKDLIFSPSDFLMIIFPFMLLLFPEPYKSIYHLDIIAFKGMIMLASIHLLIRRHPKYFSQFRMIMIIALFWVALVSIGQMRPIYS